MNKLVVFCIVVGMAGLSYSLCLVWQDIQELQALSVQHGIECEYHFPAP